MPINELRKQIINDLEALFFTGGYGGAILIVEDVKNASDEELIKIARQLGYSADYETTDDIKKK